MSRMSRRRIDTHRVFFPWERRRGALRILVDGHDRDRCEAAEEEDPRAPSSENPDETAPLLPRKEDSGLVVAAGGHGLYHSMKSFIWMSGIRIANAMKPTAPPMTIIMSGSSRLVSAWTRVSICVS